MQDAPFIERRKKTYCRLTRNTQWVIKFWPILMFVYFLNNAIFLPAVFEGPLELYYRAVAVIGLPIALFSIIYWQNHSLRKIAASIAFGRFVSAIIPAMFSPPANSFSPLARVINTGISAIAFLLIASVETPFVKDMAWNKKNG